MVMANDSESILPASLTIKAMRDNGYRNTTYAIAELIDNSVQANARNIELMCYDVIVPINKQERQTIHKIAVADDGIGMSVDELKKAVRFGDGTRLNDRRGIGRFGMGLPNSTVSQCKRLDVYTWRDGEVPFHTYLSVDEIEAGNDKVPSPSKKHPDSYWERFSSCAKSPSGTIVIWSELDRVNWKKSTTVIKKSESTIGRIYRNLIKDKTIKITAITFVENSHTCEEHVVRVNDPCYLIKPSSTPPPYDNDPMFDLDKEITETCSLNGEKHKVKIKFSVVKPNARKGRDGGDGGDEEWGKHAKNNIGVSLMRADRELELDTNIVNMYDPRERWWGVEVSFPPTLDEMFGVTNTKQTATNFARVAKAIESKQLELEDGDPDLRRIVETIDNQLGRIRGRIRAQRIGTRTKNGDGGTRHDPGFPATTVTKIRQNHGHKGESDGGEGGDPKKRIDELTKTLVADDICDPKTAEGIAHYTIDNELKYTIVPSQLPGYMLFDVLASNGVIIVKLNQNHPTYNNLIEVVKDVPEEGGDIDEFRKRLQRANKGLGLLLLAWARLEDEQSFDKRRDIENVRLKWSEILSEFLESNT